jgi:hypothetical protein
MLLNTNRIEINGRYYMVCGEKCYDVDGEELKGAYCGALIDVTDMPVVRVAECQCGIESNHRSTYNERTA